MKKILFLHNEPFTYEPGLIERRFLRQEFHLDVCRCSQGEFPSSLQDYSGVFISGSPNGAYEPLDWINRQHDLIQRLAEKCIPTLGVCFGSQILASALCGRDQVFIRPACEVGYTWIHLTEPARQDPLTIGLGRRFRLFVWHNDEVKAGHPSIRLLGSSNQCPTQIWRFEDLPMWGILGHPELTRRSAGAFFEKYRPKLSRDGAQVDKLISQASDTRMAKILLNNFAALCQTDQR